jgi:hypothetical protein
MSVGVSAYSTIKPRMYAKPTTPSIDGMLTMPSIQQQPINCIPEAS